MYRICLNYTYRLAPTSPVLKSVLRLFVLHRFSISKGFHHEAAILLNFSTDHMVLTSVQLGVAGTSVPDFSRSLLFYAHVFFASYIGT